VNRVKGAAACAIAALLGGCSLAPKYQTPAAPEVNNFKEAGDWMPAAPADGLPHGAWWEPFGDPQLNDLERQLNTANPDLRGAVARFEEARAVARRARSDVFPTVGADVSDTRGKGSTNAPLTRALSASPVVQNDFIGGIDLSWEVDVFGRLRNTAAAAGAQAQASAADLAAVQLSLQAELASDYFSLRGADTTVQLLQDTIKVYDHAYALTRNRYTVGVSAAT
jgi:multidrug efflux system outer membrane protein